MMVLVEGGRSPRRADQRESRRGNPTRQHSLPASGWVASPSSRHPERSRKCTTWCRQSGSPQGNRRTGRSPQSRPHERKRAEVVGADEGVAALAGGRVAQTASGEQRGDRRSAVSWSWNISLRSRYGRTVHKQEQSVHLCLRNVHECARTVKFWYGFSMFAEASKGDSGPLGRRDRVEVSALAARFKVSEDSNPPQSARPRPRGSFEHHGGAVALKFASLILACPGTRADGSEGEDRQGDSYRSRPTRH